MLFIGEIVCAASDFVMLNFLGLLGHRKIQNSK